MNQSKTASLVISDVFLARLYRSFDWGGWGNLEFIYFSHWKSNHSNHIWHDKSLKKKKKISHRRPHIYFEVSVLNNIHLINPISRVIDHFRVQRLIFVTIKSVYISTEMRDQRTEQPSQEPDTVFRHSAVGKKLRWHYKYSFRRTSNWTK